MQQCHKCLEEKSMEEFARGRTWCKACSSEYQRERRNKLRYDPHELLYRSCERAVARGQSTSGRYKNVCCAWKSPADMRDELTKDVVFWGKWLLLCDLYELSGGQANLRPTIDRKDENGHYELGNIDALSKRDNTLKATQKPVFAFNLDTWSFTEYPSQKNARERIGKGFKAMDKGIAFSPQGVPYIIQSEFTTQDKTGLVRNRYAGMNNEQITVNIKSKLDKSRRIIKSQKRHLRTQADHD